MIVSMLRDKYQLKESEVALLTDYLFNDQGLYAAVEALNEKISLRKSDRLLNPKEVYSFCSQVCKELFEDSIRNIAPSFSKEWDSLSPDRREKVQLARSRQEILSKFKRILEDLMLLEKEISQ